LEKVAQRWTGISSEDKEQGLTIINNTTYGFDCCDGELRSSLLRSPAYAGHPQEEGFPITRQDRFEKRMDQGEHEFCFNIRGGSWTNRRQEIQVESQVKNEGLIALCCWPDGRNEMPLPIIKIENPCVSLGALKKSESGDYLIIRLLSNSDSMISTRLKIPLIDTVAILGFRPYELKTLIINLKTKEIRECDLLEK